MRLSAKSDQLAEREGFMATTQWEAVLAMPVTQDRDHIQGTAHAAVTLVQYGDYECPNSGEEVAPEVRDAVARHRAP
jgi:hypothetical protein